MTIQVGDPRTGAPPCEGVYIGRVRDPSYTGEMFYWRGPNGWSKPYRTALACLEDNQDQLGHALPRHKLGGFWGSPIYWRTYSEPPLFPVVKPAPEAGRDAVSDLLKQAFGQ